MSIANKLAEERRARLAAERLLELKQAELFAANRKLGRRAKALSDEIVETRSKIILRCVPVQNDLLTFANSNIRHSSTIWAHMSVSGKFLPSSSK